MFLNFQRNCNIGSFRWLKNGSQELVYGDDNSVSLVKIIEQNKIIIERLNKEENGR